MKPKKAVKKDRNKKLLNISKQVERINHLEEINQNKLDFIAAVSHELRTPLAIIKQLVLLMYDETAGSINDQQREILVKSRHNIDRLKNMLDNLLDISAFERDSISLSYSLVNVNNIFKESEDFFKHIALEKRVDLKYFPLKESLSVFVDAERIQQVVTNLINNAKYIF